MVVVKEKGTLTVMAVCPVYVCVCVCFCQLLLMLLFVHSVLQMCPHGLQCLVAVGSRLDLDVD